MMNDVGIWVQQGVDRFECSYCGFISTYEARYCPCCWTYMGDTQDVREAYTYHSH